MAKIFRLLMQKPAETNNVKFKYEYIATILTHIISSLFVILVTFCELYRLSYYRDLFNETNYLIFIFGAGYTGVFVRSLKYNPAMIFAAWIVLNLSFKHGFFIDPGELGRHAKAWNNNIGIYAIIGWICTIIYFISTVINTIFNFVESLLPERIRRMKKDSNHMLF